MPKLDYTSVVIKHSEQIQEIYMILNWIKTEIVDLQRKAGIIKKKNKLQMWAARIYSR